MSQLTFQPADTRLLIGQGSQAWSLVSPPSNQDSRTLWTIMCLLFSVLLKTRHLGQAYLLSWRFKLHGTIVSSVVGRRGSFVLSDSETIDRPHLLESLSFTHQMSAKLAGIFFSSASRRNRWLSDSWPLLLHTFERDIRKKIIKNWVCRSVQIYDCAGSIQH